MAKARSIEDANKQKTELREEITQAESGINAIDKSIATEDQLYHRRATLVADAIRAQEKKEEMFSSTIVNGIMIEGTRIFMNIGTMYNEINAQDARKFLKKILPHCTHEIDKLEIMPVSYHSKNNTIRPPQGNMDYDGAFAITVDDHFDAIAKAILLKTNTEILLTDTNNLPSHDFRQKLETFTTPDALDTDFTFSHDDINYIRNEASKFRLGKPYTKVTAANLEPSKTPHRKGKEH